MCHEIFDLHFFHDSIPSRPLINRLKYFRIHIRQDIRRKKKSAVCTILRSQAPRCALCIIPWSQEPQCASHCGVKLCGVHHTAELSDQKCVSRCASLPRVELGAVHHTSALCNVHHTSESDSAVCITPQSQ